MVRQYDGKCQANEIGTQDCACEWCTRLRVAQVEEFVRLHKLCMAYCPALPEQYDEDGYLLDQSGEHTVKRHDRAWSVVPDESEVVELLNEVRRAV